ncbi:hypothetical protein AMTRI_Chr09g38450 [Amborella trichopoda]
MLFTSPSKTHKATYSKSIRYKTTTSPIRDSGPPISSCPSTDFEKSYLHQREGTNKKLFQGTTSQYLNFHKSRLVIVHVSIYPIKFPFKFSACDPHASISLLDWISFFNKPPKIERSDCNKNHRSFPNSLFKFFICMQVS